MRSITFRLTLWYAIAATLTAALFIGVGRYALERSYVAGLDDLNDMEFEEIEPRMNSVGAGGAEEVVASVLRHTEIDASLFFFQIGRDDSSAFFTSSNMAGHRLPEEVHRFDRVTVNDPHLGLIRVAEYDVGGYDLHIASSLQGWQTLSDRLLRFAAVILLSVFLTSLAVGYALSRVALNPIASIRATASRIGAENLSERIEKPNTKDEIAQLTVLLNDMFDRIEKAVRQAQRFAADASHELKTPLSLVRLRAEELLRGDSSLSEEGRRELEAQLEDISRLGRVIDDLLIVSKAEAGVLKLDAKERSTQRFLEEFSEDARALCEDRGIRFKLDAKSFPIVRFDDVWMRHTIFNLLSNALRVSREGGEIRLESREDQGFWTLVLEDEGPGVEEAKLTRIFDRFFSEDLDGQGRGSGLGLALCRSIVDQHGGTIVAMNRSDRSGLRVEMRVPLVAGESDRI